MNFTGQLGTSDSMPGNIALGMSGENFSGGDVTTADAARDGLTIGDALVGALSMSDALSGNVTVSDT